MRSGRRKSLILTLLLTAGLTAAMASYGADAAKSASPKLSGQKARVAQGGKVDLAASRLSSVELAALRPNYEKLRPRVHSQSE